MLQRTMAEAILSLLLLERRLRASLRLDGTRTVSNDRIRMPLTWHRIQQESFIAGALH
jgi:hypothetical protein